MITFRCDRCERDLSVEDDRAGTRFECPYCGDMNHVPTPTPTTPEPSSRAAPERPAGREDRAAAAGYPPHDGPEQLVLWTRPAMARANPVLFFLLVVMFFGGGALWVAFAFASAPSGWSWLLWVGVVLMALAAVGFFIWRLAIWSSALEITTKRTIQHTGLLSRRTSEVLHDNIRNIQIDQSFLDRVMRVGKMSISSAGQDDIEIQIRDIPSPLKLRKIIDLYRPL